MKKSFSQTLTYHYQFAGHIEDSFTLNCNDHGGDYIATRVAGAMSAVLDQKAETDQVEQLLPCNPYDKYLVELRSLRPLLAAQIKITFSVGHGHWRLIFWHSIADASALASNCIKEDISKVVIEGSCLMTLRAKIGDIPGTAVSALIWVADISIAQENPPDYCFAANMVNLRNRMNPPLPERCIELKLAEWPLDQTMDYNGLAVKLRESIQIDDER
ncbi:hypothetical protein ACOSP7_025314 [Xanthoceras sorbifolium]